MGGSRGTRTIQQAAGMLAGVTLLLLAPLSGRAHAQESDALCAKVKIEIAQELTLERQAFDAHMRINNGLTHISLEDVAVTVNFADADGNPVLATSDPDDTSALFFIREDSLENIAAVDGTGPVAPATAADIHWLIIPAPGAANGVPQGTLYYVGATLSYTLGGEAEVMEVTPDYIYVKPMPELALDYFLPEDVYGDDAFTAEIEPPIPFSLGVRVRNGGQGTARSVQIESGQPKIVENELGLLVGFAIAGSEVNGTPAAKSLKVDFGDIAPGACGVGRWALTCTLSGRFTEFTAEYTHSDELGGRLTSLLTDPVTHTLVRDVLVDVPGRDAVRDFLARDVDVYRVYESEGVDTEVADLSASAALSQTGQVGTEVRYALTTPIAAGLSYVKLTDPQAGKKEIKEVVRSDGKRIKGDNAWLSKSRNKDQGSPQYLEWEYYLNLFDADATGSYTVVFDTPAAQPNAPVLQFIADQTRVEGEAFSFVVQATDPDGTTPTLSATAVPAGANFVDEGGGIGRFTWTTRTGQAGRYPVTFIASDGALQAKRTATLTVNPIWDTDGDGMADAWELEHFGTLDRDGTGDWDGDGISDLDEYLAGTDPDTGFAPTIPVVEAPLPGVEVGELGPTLTVRNSTDRDGDPVTYEFELFVQGDPAAPIATAAGVAEGTDSTSWTVPFALTENAGYVWRVRATDGGRTSQWAYGTFAVNVANDAPGAFAISAPAAGTAVGSGAPVLQVTNSADPDPHPAGAALTYAFEVYEDPGLTVLVAAAGGVPEGAGGTTSWTVTPPLVDGVTYHWRAVVTDEHGASTEGPVGTFTVELSNHEPTSPVASAPARGDEVAASALTLVVENAADLDGDPVTYAFEIDTVPTFDSLSKQVTTAVAEGVGTTSWDVPVALQDDTRYYWRARASDGAASGPWSEPATVFVNTANDAPGALSLHNPSDGGEVWTRTPALVVEPAADSDGDALTYEVEVYADAALTDRIAFAEGQGPAWTADELGNDRSYRWRARAVDEHGLAGEWMPAARFVVNESAFNEPPTVAVTAPGAGGLLTREDTVTLAWTDADPDSNAAVSLYFDDDAQGYDGSLIVAGIPEDDAANSYAWDVTTLPDGTYFVYAVIEDELQSAAAYSPGPVTVDRAPPAGAVVVNGGAEYTTEVAATLTLTAGDGETSVAEMRLSDDGVSWSPWESFVDERAWALPAGDGVKTVYAQFRDLAGNVSETASDAITLDTEAPSVTVASPTPGVTNDPTPELQYTVSDGTVRVLVDGTEVGKVSGDALDALADGPHTLRVEAKDAAGNVGFAEVAFTVEATAPTELLAEVSTSKGRVLSGVKVYAFTAADSYTGRSATADAAGVARLDPALFAPGSYKLRADYLGYQFWSATFDLPGTAAVPMEIAEETASVQVTQGGAPETGVRVYLFTAAGTYLGQYAVTDANGVVTFDLPTGMDYKLRADLLGGQYWSDVFSVDGGAANAFAVDTGGGVLAATVDQGDGTPVAGANVYLFSASGTYLGLSKTTDASGRASFDVPSGSFKLRCDLLGYQSWSDVVAVTTDTAIAFPIPHQDVTARVVSDYAGALEPKPYVRVHLFTEAGSYLNRFEDTDEAGEVTFRLPERAYKLRVDVLAFQYWSEPFSWSDPTIVVPEGTAEVRVTQADQPLADVEVYAFTSTGAYLSLHGATQADGTAGFRLPAQSYRFRVDHQGSQYWSADTALFPGQVNPVPVLTGGGAFTLRVTDLAGAPLAGLPCYLFDDGGSYLGESRTLTSAGEAGFDLSDGTYRFRVDHKGYSFWTDPTAASATGPFGQDLVIAQQEVTATVQRDYAGAIAPAENTPVYLFTEVGLYLGERQTTDGAGQAVFDLPDRSYRLRADYLSAQYWSDPFTAADPVITIAEGQAEVAVTQVGSPLTGVKVSAFGAGGTYLGLTELTNEQGKAYFWLPEGTYGFRADVQGSQYFAHAAISPHQVNPVDLSTGGGTFQLVLDDGGGALAGVKVHAFTAAGTYLGLYGTTDDAGAVGFTLSDGSYLFRADYLGYPFWSGPHEVPAESSALFSVPHEELTVTVEGRDPAPFPLPGIRTYLFTEGGVYLNRFADTDAAGQVRFSLPAQSYQVRADTLGYSFWSEPFTWTDPVVAIDHGTASLHVTQGGLDLAGARVYLFTVAGAYQDRFETTDATGSASFSLPARAYKFRMDFDGTQTWSETLEIQGGVAIPLTVEVGTP